ncbi:MAG: LOG family protein [marine benthic group bacterium]|jgi:uncharacterized protein (TIGR00725 family)|nr:LOG family protein [Candidatus Benthicola marisminoris]
MTWAVSGEAGPAHRPLRIAVIGSAVADVETSAVAHAVGRALGRAEALLVCGGGGGVMAAAAEGASAEGGQVLGILPGDDPERAAGGVTIPLPTGLGEARNFLVVRAAEAVIAVAGGWGTLNEAAHCMKIGRPLVGVRDRLGDRFEIERFDDPAAAVARALELATERRAAGRPAHESR